MLYVSLVTALLVIIILWLVFANHSAKVLTSNKTGKKTKVQLMLKDCYNDGKKQFNLISYDEGESWMVLELFEDKKPRILGNVENIHPSVLHNPTNWQELRDYTISKGPIKLSDKKGVRLLRRCGFDVRLKVD